MTPPTNRYVPTAFSGKGEYRGVHIGDARGKIALWLDEDSARVIAGLFPYDDKGAAELYEAIDSAYPPRSAGGES